MKRACLENDYIKNIYVICEGSKTRKCTSDEINLKLSINLKLYK